MSEYTSAVAISVLCPPSGPVRFDSEIIGEAEFRSWAEPMRKRPTVGILNKNGVVSVGNESARRLSLEPIQEGLVATEGISRCTGLAGFARLQDGGSLQFVSHYSGMRQSTRFTNLRNPIVDHLKDFPDLVDEHGGSPDPLQYLVAYTESEHKTPGCGARRGDFKYWRYLDQIHFTVGELSCIANVLLLPYGDNPGVNNLAAGRIGTVEGIFWNGVQVSFTHYLQ